MSTSKYFLLLSYLFHDAPHWANKAYTLFPTYEEFTGNIIENCHRIGIKSEHHEKIKVATTSFSENDAMATLKKHAITPLFFTSPEYPSLLKEIASPPLTLYYKGNISLLQSPALAVVGSRNPSDYGKDVTHRLSAELSHYFVIVSGLALGTDAIAHKAALSEKNTTIAVVANGLDLTHPKTNTDIKNDIETKGLILSEHPPETPPLNYRFPQRNRIISGLSKGVLVTEATNKSGTLITAKYATEQNREIFAVPGPINSELSEGPHRLIQDGARLTHTAKDVLSELHIKPLRLPFKTTPKQEPKKQPTGLSESEKIIFYALEQEKSIDMLNEELDLQVHEILQFLTLLEAKGLIKQTASQHYIRQ
jgi:DNA processing protein